RVLAATRPDGRIADVAEAEVTLEALDVRRGEDVADQPLALLDVEPAVVVRDDPGRILAAVLDRDQAVVDLVDRVLGTDDADATAHRDVLRRGSQGSPRSESLSDDQVRRRLAALLVAVADVRRAEHRVGTDEHRSGEAERLHRDRVARDVDVPGLGRDAG